LAPDIENTFERYGPMVMRRCRALLRDEGEAQDATQDVFVALLRREEHLDDQAPAALLLRVATNICLNRLRTRRRRPEDREDERLLQIAALDDGEGQTLARNILDKLFGAGDPLAASTRTIAVMHLLDGMTLEEVAREAGLSVSGVRKRLRGLRARLDDLNEVTP
jgi:RNA polymerase sigma-70 factor (ECF subfamily)